MDNRRNFYKARKDLNRGKRRDRVASANVKPPLQAAHYKRRAIKRARFYKSYTWIQTSRRYRKQHPLCEIHRHIRELKPCDLVHHIHPLDEGGDQLNHDNLMSVCNQCHGIIHKILNEIKVKPWGKDPVSIRRMFLEKAGRVLNLLFS